MEQAVVMIHEFARPEAERDPIIIACQQGDRESFHLLFEKHKDRVYSIALHFSGNAATAHDIAQQVFLKLLSNIGKFNWQSDFNTWLYRMVANVCFDEQRRWRRLIPFGEAQEVMVMQTSENIEASYQRIELAEVVRGAICKLKPKLRLPILLKYIEGMSYEEIAQVLDCSIGTVASRLNRGHKALAQKLGHLRKSLEREDV